MKELWIDLKPDSGKALYEQIYEYIRKDITDGKISPGEKLPSTRFLAKCLQISRSTVDLAYEQLAAEGYIMAKPCAGFFVCDISALYQLQKEAFARKTDVTQKKTEKEYAVSFSPFEVDVKNFPYAIWAKVQKRVLMQGDGNLLSPGEAKGEENLRMAISRYLYRARGVACGAEQIILGAGNEYLLVLLAQILGPDKKVLMEHYTYPQAYHTFSNMGYELVTTGVDEDGVSMEGIRMEQPDMVYVMPAHQFPLGNVMPLKRRLELLQWASESKERYIIEDDHDSEFRYKGKPIPALWGNDSGEHVIYIGTFSKSIAPSLRISFMVLPERLVEQYDKKCSFYACTVPKSSQEVLCHFMEEGHFERHLNRMRNLYKNKHDIFVRMLKQETWVHAVYGDYAGLHVLVEVVTSREEEEIVRRAQDAGVLVHGLLEYQMNQSRALNYPTLLLGYANLSEEEMRQGLSVLRQVIL